MRPERSFTLSCLRAALTAGVFVCGAAQAERVHRFAVAIDPELSEIGVRACFDGKPPEALVAESLDAPLALRGAWLEPDRHAIEPSGSISLKSVPENGCLAYKVDVSRPIRLHDRTGEKIRRVGRDLLTSVGIWLWRPERLGADEDVEIAFDLPAGISVSAPWQPVGGASRPTFRLGRTPVDWPASVAFGRFSERSILIGDARLRLAVLEGSPPADVEQMAQWIADSARMVAGVYGHFPFPQAQVVVVPDARGREPTPWAYVVRGGSPAVYFMVNQRRPIEAFFDDWTATHELSHLLLPFVSHEDAWLSEGLATYYQNVLRARAGRMSGPEAWSRLHAGFQRGRRNARGLTLAQATENMNRNGLYMRVYWEGTAMLLLADMRLRQLTAGKQSLDTALAALHECCLQTDREWSAAELFARLDEITGTSVFSGLYDVHVGSTDFPDLSTAYRQLGLLPAGDGVELVGDARLAAMRDAIMRGDPQRMRDLFGQ